MSEMTPERLDAILDGRAAPTDDEARDMLALAGALREAVPSAGEGLRERVRALSRPQPTERPRWLRASGWRGRILIGAPALSAVIAAVITVGVIARSPDGQSGGSDALQAERASQTTDETGPLRLAVPPTAAPTASGQAAGTRVEPIVVQIPPATLDARVAEVRQLVAAAGGTIVEEPRQTAPPRLLASITLPGQRRAEVLQAIAALGNGARNEASDAVGSSAGDVAGDGDVINVRVLLTEGP